MSENPQEPAHQELGADRRAAAWDLERYLLKNLLQELDVLEDPGSVNRFLGRLEADQFLARQVELPDGFETAGRQIERHLFPAAVRAGDWERFMRYLLTAITFRRLGRALDDPAILQGLVRSGRLALAEAMVGRISDPVDRTRGWAVLAETCSPANPSFQRLVEALRAELDRMPEPGGADPETVERWGDALATAGRLLALRLRARWGGWIARLGRRQDLSDRVRIAVAEGFFEADEAGAPELWEILRAVEDPGELVRLLPDRIAAGATGDPLRRLRTFRKRLGRVGDSRPVHWAVGLALLARSDDVVEGWRRMRTELGRPPWGSDLLERGARIWPRLADEDLRELAADLERPDHAALLRVLVLEGRRDCESYEAVLSLLEEGGLGDGAFSLYLRVLRAAPVKTRSELRSRVKSLLSHLSELQYAVPSADLACALNLVARHLSRRRLRRTIDAALAAPDSGADTLRAVVDRVEEDALHEELLERAETYAALASADAAEGFELRGEILVRLGCREVARDGGFGALEALAERLLPDEEDRLRAGSARVLARLSERGSREKVEALCDGIRDPALRLRVRLEVLPEDIDPGDLVSPRSLYRVAARWPSVEDALRGLAGLLEEPHLPGRLAQERFGSIESLGRRVEGLADLAHHALAYQERHFRADRQDRLAAVLPLKEALGVIESDRWLVSLTPELVAIGAHLGVSEAVAEVQEAVERVIGLDGVSWERRETALIQILARLEKLFLEEGSDAPLRNAGRREREKSVQKLLAWLVGLAERGGDDEAAGRLRSRWYRLLPVLAAVVERIERRCQPDSFWFSSLVPIPWPGGSRSPREALQESARLGRRWAPQRREVFDLCVAPPEERRKLARRLVETPGQDADQESVRALAWLLASEESELVPKIVGSMQPGGERDRTVVELLRCGPPLGPVATELLGLLSGSEGGVRDWGAIWLGLRDSETVSEEDWLNAVARLVAHDRLDPAAPETIPVRRRLWTVGDGTRDGRPVAAMLAEAARGALETGGAAGGERAARLILDCLVQPRLGEAASEQARERLWQMQRAVEHARSLENGPDPGSEQVESRSGRCC